jgi:hypothetical protein
MPGARTSHPLKGVVTETSLQLVISPLMVSPMGLPIKAVLPSAPVTLSQQQIEELYRLLAEMRHDINNDLSKIVGTAELIKLELGKVGSDPAKPLRALDRMPMLLDQPRKISAMLEQFSKEFEKTLGITRP